MDKPMIDVIIDFLQETGFAQITWQQGVMLVISWFLIYLAIKKKYEPLLLLPIAFGMLLANLPLSGLWDPPVGEYGTDSFKPGLLYYLYMGVKLESIRP